MESLRWCHWPSTRSCFQSLNFVVSYRGEQSSDLAELPNAWTQTARSSAPGKGVLSAQECSGDLWGKEFPAHRAITEETLLVGQDWPEWVMLHHPAPPESSACRLTEGRRMSSFLQELLLGALSLIRWAQMSTSLLLAVNLYAPVVLHLQRT